MALTPFQRSLCRLLAERRKQDGESYVAGGVALNELLGGSRISRDVDLFHDTEEAVAVASKADRELFTAAGLSVEVLRERPGFVEVLVGDASASTRVEWVRDSAYRFFPLVAHDELGLALHPFDLATNKLLALIGRREPRDWIDVLHCDAALQPLGYLAWAACGKDPGYNPRLVLEHAARGGRFSTVELASLAFSGEPPDAAALARRWHDALTDAAAVLAALPAEHVGCCVLEGGDALCRLGPADLSQAMAAGRVGFRSGSIRGAFPELRS
jgi:hypothetical protein